MIRPEELRIGSLVEDDFSSVLQVCELRMYCALLDNYNKEERYADLFGIALTSEWLERFGFERRGQFKSWDICYPFLTWEQTLTVEGDKGFTAYVTTDNGKSASISNILYVHQLQNLYFALTGNELQISAPTPE